MHTDVLWWAVDHIPARRHYPWRSYGHIGIWGIHQAVPARMWLSEDMEIPLAAGAALVSQPYRPFKLHLPSDGEVTRFGMNLRVRFAGGIGINNLLRLPDQLPPTDADWMLQALRGQVGREPSSLALHCQKQGIAMELLQRLLARSEPTGNDLVLQLQHKRLQEIVDCALAHLADPPRCQDLARRMHCSTRWLQTLIREAFGITPKTWLLRLRMDRARDLLLEGDQHLADIAAELGFYDQFHFSRVFKQMHGMPPSRYRREQAVASGGAG